MKKVFVALLVVAAGLSLTGCELLEELFDQGIEIVQGADYQDKWASLVNETTYGVVVDGNTLTYGSHVYAVLGEIDYDITEYDRPTASVMFYNIPSGATEFKAVYEGLLGLYPQGAAAMVPMAMEIYARDAETGKKCFEILCKDSATVDGIIRILKTKIVPSAYGGADDNYIQRYLPAALLKGARYDNSYKPEEPYVVEMCASRNKPQETKLDPYGTVYYTYILSDGWDSRNRDVDLFLPEGESLYKVQGCASCYTQCRNMASGGVFGGLK